MTVTISLFFDRLRASELLDPDDVDFLWQRVPPDKRQLPAEKLAPKLVDAGKLTAYQAQALIAGGSDPLVLGEYVVLSRIGAGGMGQVFKAEHRRMKREVALKVLSADAVRSPDAVKRFHQEVQAAARLLHQNIVTAFDAGESEGVHFLVMECVEGQDLAIISRAEGAMNVQRVVEYTLQAARGLAYAHGKGVVHRDIKPANLLVDRDGVVKILDMGLARIEAVAGAAAMGGREQLTHSGQVMGTLDYMAPEQAYDTRTADGRSDIYSLGCTMYRLLTGETLFGGDSLVQVIMAHRDKPVPSLREKRPDVPAALDAIFQKMLAKTPEGRQGSMNEVVAALEALKSGAAPIDAGVSPAEPDQQLGDFFRGTGTASRPPPRQTGHEIPAAPSPFAINVSPVSNPPGIGAPAVGSMAVGARVVGAPGSGSRLTGDTNPRANTSTNAALPSPSKSASRGKAKKTPTWLVAAMAVAGCVFLAAIAVLAWNATKSRGGQSAKDKEGKKTTKEEKPSLSLKPIEPAKQSSKPIDTTPKKLGALPAGKPADKFPGLLTDPPRIDGFGRWQVESTVPRRAVTAVAWTPDNSKIVVGSEGGELRVYEPQDWRLVQVMYGHTSTITALAWRPDGSRLASCANDNTVRLWHEDGAPGPTMSKRNRPASLAWSPSGDWLAMGSSDKNVGKPEVFNANGGAGPASQGITGGVTGLSWHFEGKQFVTSSDDKSLRIWNLDGTFGKELKGHNAALRGVSWSRSGKIATFDSEGTVYIHPVDGQDPWDFSKVGAKAVAWSPDGTKLAVGLASTIQIWDAEGKPTLQQQPTFGSPTSLAWSSDGRNLAWAGGSVGVWEPGGNSSLLPLATVAKGLDWHPAGDRFVSFHDDDRLRWWRSAGTLEHAGPPAGAPLSAAVWNPNGELLVAGGGKSLFFFGADNGPRPTFDPKQSTVNALAWNRAGDQLIVAGNGANLQIWNLDGTSRADLDGHAKKPVTHVAWNQATGQIATAGSDNTIRIWQSEGSAGEEIDAPQVTALRWSPSGAELAAAMREKNVYLLRVYSPAGSMVREIKLAAETRSLAWSPDGELLLCGEKSGLIRMWSKDGESVKSLAGHSGEIRSLVWSNEGNLLSCADDRTIRCWNTSGVPIWISVSLSNEEFLTISAADGKALGPSDTVQKQVAYLVERDGGRIEILGPTDFFK